MSGTDVRQILVVEDQPGSRLALVELLKDEGHDVGAAENGTTALELVDAKAWELLVLDYHLGDMTGAELLRKVRERGNRCHAIMVSGSVGIAAADGDLSVDDHWSECRELGACAQLAKPINFDHLLRVIDELPPVAAQ